MARHGGTRTAQALVAVLVALWSLGCPAAQRADGFTTLEISRVDVTPAARGGPRRWSTAAGGSVTELADELGRCATREIVKFKATYRVDASRASGSTKVYLVWRDYVKVDGLAFSCPRNVEALIDRLWSEASEPAPADALQLWVHDEAVAGREHVVLTSSDGAIIQEWGTAELPDERDLDEVKAAARAVAPPSHAVVIRARGDVKFGTIKRFLIALGPVGSGGFVVYFEPMKEFPLRIVGPRRGRGGSWVP